MGSYQNINSALVKQKIPQRGLATGWVCVHDLSIPAQWEILRQEFARQSGRKEFQGDWLLE